eukprot:jgi/Phyca11/132109/e_gw1.134.7.1
MGRAKGLTDQERWWIIGLHDAGISLHEISRKSGRSRSAILKAIREERGPRSDVGEKQGGPGRPPALTERDVRRIVRAASGGDLFAAELKTKLGLKPSVRTVQRVLQRVDHLVFTISQQPTRLHV